MAGELLNKVRYVSIPDGSSNLTRANFTGMTPDRFQAMATTAYNEAKLLTQAVEARAVGVVASSFEELLNSRIAQIDKKAIQEKKVPQGSIILPFSYRQRKANTPQDDFNIVAGASDTTYSTHGWKITVKFSPKWAATWGGAVPTFLARYFLKDEYIYAEFVNSAGTLGTDRDVRLTPFKVVATADVDGSGNNGAYVWIEPCVTTTTWTGLTAAQKAVHQPTHGYLHLGTNNVADEESWAKNQASDLSKSLLVDWHQTSRYTQHYNDVYADTLKRVLNGDVNDYQTAFANLSLADQNKQQYARYKRKWLNSVVYGQAINENQTVEGYNNLPQVVDPENAALYAYKANALGLRTLLANENQVVDLHGADLDLKVVFDLAWKLKRNREATGESHEVICFQTDKDTASKIDVQILTACKNFYGENITRFYEKGEVRANDGEIRYVYKKYDLPGQDFQLAIFVEKFLTDRLYNFGDGTGGAEGSVNFKQAGRAMWAVDWNDFNIGIVATNSAKREFKGDTYANAFELYSAVITPNTKHYDLRSTTWTTQIGDAKRSLMIENFNSVATLSF